MEQGGQNLGNGCLNVLGAINSRSCSLVGLDVISQVKHLVRILQELALCPHYM